jgi:hypothetical protein
VRRLLAPRAEQPEWALLDELEEYRDLTRIRLEHLVEVRQPWVLISQIQRSGGTLLNELFDGHPEVHAHPYEVKIGRPRKFNWPPLDLARPDSWFDVLFEKRSAVHFIGGYHKSAKKRNEYDAFPFVFLPRLQKAIFDHCVEDWAPRSDRGVLDCYFTSYFNAWLDNENLYARPKRIVTGFTPRLAMDPANVERYFDAYPDGTLVSIVREPGAWWLSASGYQPERYADLEDSVRLWRESAEAALAARARHGDRVVVLTYERLVQEPERTMRMLAERLGISMLPVLLEPTFNGRPIRANSSGAVERYGVLAERSEAGLDSGMAERIAAVAGDVYDRAAATVSA